MLTRRSLIASPGLLLLARAAWAQSTASGATVVFEQDLPDLTMNNWTATVVEVSYPPGRSSPSHKHPGITIAYVLEGAIRSKVGDGPERTYKAGEVFLETPGQVHAVSANASETEPARLLAVMLAEKGAPRTAPSDE